MLSIPDIPNSLKNITSDIHFKVWLKPKSKCFFKYIQKSMNKVENEMYGRNLGENQHYQTMLPAYDNFCSISH